MTPRLQTSTSGPLYFFPWNSSGAAYGGLPQKVSNLEPGVNSLLKPSQPALYSYSRRVISSQPSGRGVPRVSGGSTGHLTGCD